MGLLRKLIQDSTTFHHPLHSNELTHDNMATGSEFDHIPNGYAKLAAIQTKEQEYVILRRFRWLSARNLLYYQAEITALEYQLKFLEDRMRNECRTDVLRSWPTFAEDDTRCEIVLKIRQLLREYSRSTLFLV